MKTLVLETPDLLALSTQHTHYPLPAYHHDLLYKAVVKAGTTFISHHTIITSQVGSIGHHFDAMQRTGLG